MAENYSRRVFFGKAAETAGVTASILLPSFLGEAYAQQKKPLVAAVLSANDLSNSPLFYLAGKDALAQLMEKNENMLVAIGSEGSLYRINLIHDLEGKHLKPTNNSNAEREMNEAEKTLLQESQKYGKAPLRAIYIAQDPGISSHGHDLIERHVISPSSPTYTGDIFSARSSNQWKIKDDKKWHRILPQQFMYLAINDSLGRMGREEGYQIIGQIQNEIKRNLEDLLK